MPLRILLPRTSVIKLLFVRRTVDSITVSCDAFGMPLQIQNSRSWAVNNPDLGRAGMPYARNVQTKKSLPLSALPDPGLVFDTLLKARDVSPWSPFYSYFT